MPPISLLPRSAAQYRQLHSTCAQFCRQNGYGYFLYLVPLVNGELLLAHGGKKVHEKTDKGILRLDADLSAILDTLSNEPETSAAEILVDQLLRTLGLKLPSSHRRFFPIQDDHGALAIFVLAADTSEVVSVSNFAVPQLQQLTRAIHNVELHRDHSPTPLTKRENECLQWAVEGKTNWEISQILGVTERTIVFHMQNVVSKLKATNRQHAIAQAVAQGLVTPRQ